MRERNGYAVPLKEMEMPKQNGWLLVKGNGKGNFSSEKFLTAHNDKGNAPDPTKGNRNAEYQKDIWKENGNVRNIHVKRKRKCRKEMQDKRKGNAERKCTRRKWKCTTKEMQMQCTTNEMETHVKGNGNTR